jgi:hypothetical protein
VPAVELAARRSNGIGLPGVLCGAYGGGAVSLAAAKGGLILVAIALTHAITRIKGEIALNTRYSAC